MDLTRIALTLGIDPSLTAALAPLFSERRLVDGETFLRPGDRPVIGFIGEGVVRHHVADAKGREKTTDFCQAGDFTGALPGQTSDDNQWFTAVGPVTLAVADAETLMSAISLTPGLLAAFSRILGDYLMQKTRREAELLALEPAERYESFIGRNPSLANTVPQYLVASYLGIAPETLSRIRSRRSR